MWYIISLSSMNVISKIKHVDAGSMLKYYFGIGAVRI